MATVRFVDRNVPDPLAHTISSEKRMFTVLPTNPPVRAFWVTTEHGPPSPRVMLIDKVAIAPVVVIVPSSAPACCRHGAPPVSNAPANDASDCVWIVHRSAHTLFVVAPSSRRASTVREPIHVPRMSGNPAEVVDGFVELSPQPASEQASSIQNTALVIRARMVARGYRARPSSSSTQPAR
jgi:hypothetical protein